MVVAFYRIYRSCTPIVRGVRGRCAPGPGELGLPRLVFVLDENAVLPLPQVFCLIGCSASGSGRSGIGSWVVLARRSDWLLVFDDVPGPGSVAGLVPSAGRGAGGDHQPVRVLAGLPGGGGPGAGPGGGSQVLAGPAGAAGFAVPSGAAVFGDGCPQGAPCRSWGSSWRPAPAARNSWPATQTDTPRQSPCPTPGPARSLFPLCDWPDEGGPATAGQRTLPAVVVLAGVRVGAGAADRSGHRNCACSAPARQRCGHH